MRKKLVLAAAVAIAVSIGGGVAWATGAIASVVAADGTVYGCYAAGGQLRVVSETQACRPTESRIQLLGVTAKAADSDKLDGKDSSDFYAAGSKVADADAVDGLDSEAFQVRVGGECAAGSAIRSVASDGTVACETDDDTTYTGAHFALSSQACPPGKVTTAVNADGTLRCDGQLQGPKGDKGDPGETGALGPPGPQGPAGLPGASGYVVVSTTEAVPANTRQYVNVFCPAGKRAVGGGGFPGFADAKLFASAPLKLMTASGLVGRGWTVGIESGAATQLEVLVICLDA